MNNLDVTYCCVENVITVKNNSDSFTGVLWFSITDCETNLNVTCWRMNLSPLSIGYTIRLSNISKFENNVGTLIFEKL